MRTGAQWESGQVMGQGRGWLTAADPGVHGLWGHQFRLEQVYFVGVQMGVPYVVLTRLIHPPAHLILLSFFCPCLATSAFSARLWEKVGGPIMRTGDLYVLFCPQEQGRDAVLDPEDQPSSCHLLSTRLPSSRQLHEEVLSTPAAFLYHPPLPGMSSWGSDQPFLWVM